MRCEYDYAKHQRGSSPPFQIQKPKRGLNDWMKSFRSIDQHPYDASEIQMFKELKALEKQSIEEFDSKQNVIKNIDRKDNRIDDNDNRITDEKPQ